MSDPGLCKTHFRQVANYFSREVAYAFAIDESGCLICTKEIFLEGARRYVQNQPVDPVERPTFAWRDVNAELKG